MGIVLKFKLNIKNVTDKITGCYVPSITWT